MEDTVRKTTANKRLLVNQRVSGAVGDYLQGPTKNRQQQRLYGNILSAVGERRYLVRFDNVLEKECTSAVLRVETTHSSLPPDLPLPTAQTEYRVEEGDAQEELMDQEEEEPLAAESPDDDDDDSSESIGGDNEPPSGGDDPPNGMPGQLPTEGEAEVRTSKDYHAIKQLALEKISSLVGEDVVIRTRNNRSMTWKVIASHEPPDVIPEKDHRAYELKGFKLENFKKSEVISSIFLMLLFKDWKEIVVKMNEEVVASKAKCKLFSQKEFLIGLAILIGAAEFAQRGCDFVFHKG